MLPYYDEFQTLDLMISGHSIARYGDGELKLALGRDCVSQVAVPELENELKTILQDQNSPALVGIPRVIPGTMAPKAMEFWMRIENNPKYERLYSKAMRYGSSFITRPDNAPVIDCPEYWERVELLWKDKDVTYCFGTDRSLVIDDLSSAKSVAAAYGPRRDAYQYIDSIEKDIIALGNKTVLLALGATATCLAYRLAKKGFTAYDIGHIGMFMRKRNATLQN